MISRSFDAKEPTWLLMLLLVRFGENWKPEIHRMK